MVELHALLAHAFGGISAAYEEDAVTLLTWASFLRVIPDEGIGLRALPVDARISRRATRSWLPRQRAGWFTVDGKQLSLTDLGRSLRDAGEAGAAAAERSWRAQFGDADIASLRVALESLVGRLDLELPHHPMRYGTADPSVLGGRAVAAKPGPPRIPPHGSEWTPVLRHGPATAIGLPLHALLSQALLAFTIDVEEHTVASMSNVACIASTFASGPRPLDEVPAQLEVDGSGRTLYERHGVIRVRNGIADVTSLGAQLRDGYEQVLAAVRRSWSARFGVVLDELESALRGVDEPARPDFVRIGFKAGVGFHVVSH